MAKKWGLSKLLLAVSVIAFVLSAMGIEVGNLNLLDIGLAAGFGSFLV